MKNTATRLLPLWAVSVGAIARSNGLLRSQCATCGTEFREDAALLSAGYGATYSLAGRKQRCRKVACNGSVTFKVARSYGRQWIDLAQYGNQSAPIMTAKG